MLKAMGDAVAADDEVAGGGEVEGARALWIPPEMKPFCYDRDEALEPSSVPLGLREVGDRIKAVEAAVDALAAKVASRAIEVTFKAPPARLCEPHDFSENDLVVIDREAVRAAKADVAGDKGLRRARRIARNMPRMRYVVAALDCVEPSVLISDNAGHSAWVFPSWLKPVGQSFGIGEGRELIPPGFVPVDGASESPASGGFVPVDCPDPAVPDLPDALSPGDAPYLFARASDGETLSPAEVGMATAYGEARDALRGAEATVVRCVGCRVWSPAVKFPYGNIDLVLGSAACNCRMIKAADPDEG